ncbi:MAG: NADH-quinone oxidoreductase subunit J [Oligoflexales bacterium]|nr:NADH-quinone oxidoreductase subunit J [Oligoflexales bacterium]
MDDYRVFYALATTTVVLSMLVITQKQVAKAAIFLVTHLCFMAGIYAYLGAETAAAVQIIIYTVAILALFKFAIKLLSLRYHGSKDRPKTGKLESMTLVFLIVGLTAFSYAGLVNPKLMKKNVSVDEQLEPFSTAFFEQTQYSLPLLLAILLTLLTALSCRYIYNITAQPANSSDGGPRGTH